MDAAPVENLVYSLLSYAGVAVFAASGALAAAPRKHDIITFAFFAAVTGVGGGTVRDVLLDQTIFWIQDPTYIAVCVGTAAAIWFLGYERLPVRALLWLDAVGLAAFAVLGAMKTTALGFSAPVAIIMGMLTATAGGILRDMMAGEPSVLLRREIYITAALVAAAVCVVTLPFLGTEGATLLGFAAGLTLRACALAFGWTMPGFFGGVTARRRP